MDEFHRMNVVTETAALNRLSAMWQALRVNDGTLIVTLNAINKRLTRRTVSPFLMQDVSVFELFYCV